MGLLDTRSVREVAMTKAATYAAALREWRRTASEADRIDSKGKPEPPLCRVREREIAEIDDDGALFLHAHFLDSVEWAALRAFGDEWLSVETEVRP